MTIDLPQDSLKARLNWQGFTEGSDGPFFLKMLSDVQRSAYDEWFSETSRLNLIGETSVAAMGVLLGLILGNRLTRVVQCGHYAGYSLLMLGMVTKNILKNTKMASLDIDQSVTNFTDKWIAKCHLRDNVSAFVLDSSDPFAAHEVKKFLGGPPELVFIDSSHQYRHTLDELDLWASQLAPGGFICMHDAAPFSSYQDHHNLGGVHRALSEWLTAHPSVSALVLQSSDDGDLPYRDPCGLGILQIMDPIAFARPTRSSSKRMIKDPNFRYSDQWQFGEGWELGSGAVQKTEGASSSIACYAPVIAGEKYRVTATLSDVVSGGVHPGAGGSGLADFFGSDGTHSADIVAAGENALIGLLASANFRGRILSFDATLIG